MFTTILILLLISATCVIYYLLTKVSPLAISKDVEDHVTSVLKHASSVDFSLEEEDGAFYTPKIDRSRFQGKMVAIAKAEFGYLQRTKANKAMVRKFMRDFMRERGIRPTHIAQHVDVCVACFFIPSQQDMLAHQVGATRDAHTRQGIINAMWESYFGPLGRMLGFRDE